MTETPYDAYYVVEKLEKLSPGMYDAVVEKLHDQAHNNKMDELGDLKDGPLSELVEYLGENLVMEIIAEVEDEAGSDD